MAKVHAELRTMQIEVDRLRAQIKGRDAHIAELKATLANRVEEFDRQRAEIVAKDQALADKERARADRDKELVAKDAEIAALRQQLSMAAAPVQEGDDLKRVKGIGPGFERVLKQHGVSTYGQMAAWTGDDILRFAALLNTQPGRIARGAWIEQAAALASGAPSDK